MSSEPKSRICVPLHEATYSALQLAAKEASVDADVIELRLDALASDELNNNNELSSLIRSLPCSVVLTFRPAAQGGYRDLSMARRQEFWHRNFQSLGTLFDLERDLVSELVTKEVDQQPDWSRVICSHHDFDGVPQNLDYLYEQMSFTPARILKFAFKANDIVDCIRVFELLDRARSEDREIIALAMGEAGVITRILGPSRGSFVTYATTNGKAGTAPGQLLTSELKSVYRIDTINSDTMITGLVGAPVSHSVSPHMHNAAFASKQLNGVYLPFHVADLKEFFKSMVSPTTRELNWNLRGLSITAPHKTEVINYLDWIDPTAQKIGAVNTVVLQDEQLRGYNTDADGLIEPLVQRFGSLAGARAAVIGAGGAANAAIFALQQQKADVTVYVRDPVRAKSLSERFNVECESLEFASFSNSDLVINATPLGSFGNKVEETPAVASQLRGNGFIYDLVYNPIETKFMREGKAAGCQVLGGLEMLVAQARLQFKLWTNTNVSSELMYTVGSCALSRILSEKL
jgi:3-dehydroquinate dehydratase / shikimate dehydrogenase